MDGLKISSRAGSTCVGSVPLSKAKPTRSTLQLVSTRGELCPDTATIRPRHDAKCHNSHSNQHSNPLCCGTVRLGGQNHPQTRRKNATHATLAHSGRFFAYFGPSANSADIVAPTPTRTRASEVAKMAFPSTVLVFIEDRNGQPLSIGSGFVLDTGAVVTNLHVIEAGARGYVKEINSDTRHAIDGFLRADVLHDLAILSVPSLSAPKLKLASDSPAVGDTVYAIGNPRGLEGTFSQGNISAIRRLDSDTIFQITAPISPGSSGGPVLNERGEVIGIAVATFKGGQNLNFAVPSSYLERVAMLAKPAPLSKLGKKKTSSVLTAIGGRESTDGVTAGKLIWDSRVDFYGGFSFSVRNLLREGVKEITCLVIFYDIENKPLDFVLIRSPQFIPGGLAKRMSGYVDASVKKLTTLKVPHNPYLYSDAPITKVEFRILGFEIGDE